MGAVTSMTEVLTQPLKDSLASFEQRRDSMPRLNGDNGLVLRRRQYIATYHVVLVSISRSSTLKRYSQPGTSLPE